MSVVFEELTKAQGIRHLQAYNRVKRVRAAKYAFSKDLVTGKISTTPLSGIWEVLAVTFAWNSAQKGKTVIKVQVTAPQGAFTWGLSPPGPSTWGLSPPRALPPGLYSSPRALSWCS